MQLGFEKIRQFVTRQGNDVVIIRYTVSGEYFFCINLPFRFSNKLHGTYPSIRKNWELSPGGNWGYQYWFDSVLEATLAALAAEEVEYTNRGGYHDRAEETCSSEQATKAC